MAGSLNKVTLIGNVGMDPEIRSMQDGGKVANLSIATSESWKDKMTGERRDKTEWHRVVVFNDRLVDVIEKYVKKGSKLYIEGQLQTRKWTDQNGVDKYTTEVVLQKFRGDLVMLDNRSSNDNDNFDQISDEFGAPQPQQQSAVATGNANATVAAGNTIDDEIPF